RSPALAGDFVNGPDSPSGQPRISCGFGISRCGFPAKLSPMIQVKVKICGLTAPADALSAADAGADALGFNFYKSSPRCVTRKRAAEIIRELPPLIAKVGVFVNPTPEEVQAALEECGLDTLQFHGDESPEFC